VFELDDEQGCVCFQSECLLPDDGSNRTRVLLLFSNAHPVGLEFLIRASKGASLALRRIVPVWSKNSSSLAVSEEPEELTLTN
jgi:hypothetical protein